MKIVPAHEHGASAQVRTSTFTGTVWGDPVSAQDDVSINTVYFAPGGRTHWHSHPGGQALHVTNGSGWVGVRGEPAKQIRSGDVVWAPPGEEHWHGADESSFMVHLAISLGDAEWMDEVAENDYRSREGRDGE